MIRSLIPQSKDASGLLEKHPWLPQKNDNPFQDRTPVTPGFASLRGIARSMMAYHS